MLHFREPNIERIAFQSESSGSPRKRNIAVWVRKGGERSIVHRCKRCGKLRCNRVLQTLPEFYETYNIQPDDGMWTDPESRVSIW